MKFSLSTFVYYRYSLIDAIKKTAEYGYDGVEIWGGRPHAYCEDMTDERIRDAMNAVKDSGLGISCFIPAQFRYPTNLAAGDKLVRSKSVDYIKKSIDVAAKLGAPFVDICPGYSMHDQTHEEAWNAMIESFRELLQHAKGMPLKLVLEPGNRYETDLAVTVDDAIRAIKDLNAGLGILPDTGHLFVNKESLSDLVDKVKGIPAHFHIDDNMGITDDHMVPGQGKIYFDTFFQKLLNSGYKGYLAVELGFQYYDPDIAVKQSIDYLKGSILAG